MTTRPYTIQEGNFAIPATLTDRTINTFLHQEDGQTIYNLTVARDTPQSGEDGPAYVSRQIGLLKANMPNYKIADRRPAQLGAGDGAIPGEQIQATYRSGQKIVHQRQAAFFIAPDQALVFSASSAFPFDSAFEQVWHAWLQSFTR